MVSQTNRIDQPRLRASRILRLLAVAVGAALLAGCSQARATRAYFDDVESQPSFMHLASGDVVSFKRFDRHAERDFFHHFRREAYRRPPEDLAWSSPEQETLLLEWGKPGYVRGPFRALGGESVEEWIFLDQKRIFQFVGGEMVFDGPVTDYEDLMLRLGYPDDLFLTTGESGVVRQTMVYKSIFLPSRLDYYKLDDGWIISLSEGD